MSIPNSQIAKHMTRFEKQILVSKPVKFKRLARIFTICNAKTSQRAQSRPPHDVPPFSFFFKMNQVAVARPAEIKTTERLNQSQNGLIYAICSSHALTASSCSSFAIRASSANSSLVFSGSFGFYFFSFLLLDLPPSYISSSRRWLLSSDSWTLYYSISFNYQIIKECFHLLEYPLSFT